uniref:PH domain-containing protein n=1 Tax=Corethron hystrix TaxID=216773 RepID=A0A7S1FZU9_9STRA|mmetsp:Transcript_40232/g.94577  ORF Transcript_40232/g.94577 Transcript_40232/m.94577 type:complete len:843 (+) Transcript_40232:3-2531(+)
MVGHGSGGDSGSDLDYAGSSPPASSSSGGVGPSPVGIIDLECYSVVNRPGTDPDRGTVLELAGDPVTNPDLRSFYFQAEDDEDCVRWTNAFLSDRHTALMDEREAYRQVAESFPQQLQCCSDMIEEAENKRKNAELEAYRVRSAAEESRSNILGVLREALEKLGGQTLLSKLERTTQAAAFSNGITIGSGVVEAMDVLIEHAHLLKDKNAELHLQLHDSKVEVERAKRSDEVDHLHKRLDQAQQQHSIALKRQADRAASLEKLLQISRQETVDANRTLEAKQMEFGILSASTKSKLLELTQHKKILKKEVIDLRHRLDETTGSLSVLQHKFELIDGDLNTERERLIMKDQALSSMRSQMKMQERMMDMMSVTMSEHNSVSGNDENSFSPSHLVSPKRGISKAHQALLTLDNVNRMQLQQNHGDDHKMPLKVVAVNNVVDERFAPEEQPIEEMGTPGDDEGTNNDAAGSVRSGSSMSELTDHHQIGSPILDVEPISMGGIVAALDIGERDNPTPSELGGGQDKEKQHMQSIDDDDKLVLPKEAVEARETSPSPILVRPLDEMVPPPDDDCTAHVMQAATNLLYNNLATASEVFPGTSSRASGDGISLMNTAQSLAQDLCKLKTSQLEYCAAPSTKSYGADESMNDQTTGKQAASPLVMPSAPKDSITAQPPPVVERPQEESRFRNFLRRRPSFTDMSASASVGSCDAESIVTAGGTRRLSIAQRARIEADSPRSGSFRIATAPKAASPLEWLGKSLTESLDNSILGVKTLTDHLDENGEIKPNTPLRIRAQLQRDRQLKYLARQREINESNRSSEEQQLSKNEKGTAAPEAYGSCPNLDMPII